MFLSITEQFLKSNTTVIASTLQTNLHMVKFIRSMIFIVFTEMHSSFMRCYFFLSYCPARCCDVGAININLWFVCSPTGPFSLPVRNPGSHRVIKTRYKIDTRRAHLQHQSPTLSYRVKRIQSAR